jgi:hypothetical protein
MSSGAWEATFSTARSDSSSYAANRGAYSIRHVSVCRSLMGPEVLLIRFPWLPGTWPLDQRVPVCGRAPWCPACWRGHGVRWHPARSPGPWRLLCPVGGTCRLASECIARRRVLRLVGMAGVQGIVRLSRSAALPPRICRTQAAGRPRSRSSPASAASWE